ncbi:MAG: deoxyribose-phosphate aldolase [Hyphomicrobiales bacterium]
MNTLEETARRAIALLDLTNLNDECSNEDIESLWKTAQTAGGNVAAVCIWPQFVPLARKLLSGTGIKVATVANFPHGNPDSDAAAQEVAEAIANGADEVDIVIPWKAIKDGDTETATAVVTACRKEVPANRRLKVILETGELADERLIRTASGIALEAGADFIKTSTGKVPINATPESAAIMLEEIAGSGKMAGFKAAGGIKTTEDAGAYLAIADKIMGPDWAGPTNFRFGASGVLSDLLASLGFAERKAPKDGY